MPPETACNKTALTKEEANKRLYNIKSRLNNLKKNKRPCRKYYCNNCGHWHLTSLPEKTFYQLKKNLHK